MDISDDDRATEIWNELIDAVPSEWVRMDRAGHLFTAAFQKLRALGYSKEDCNDFLNANFTELEPAF